MFYTEYTAFYNVNNEKTYDFSAEVILEWKQYFKNEIKESDLEKLLFNTSLNGLDSVVKSLKKTSNPLPKNMPNLKGIPVKRRNAFLNYLTLAKKAEKYASWEGRGGWSYERAAFSIPIGLDQEIEQMLQKSKDPFIKQRLLFQLIRNYYFQESQDSTLRSAIGEKLTSTFWQYDGAFSKNIMYYRTLGYVAGHHYLKKEYARANYLYSLCYNFSATMKMSAKWSFHPKEEADWNETLAMAKTKEERITLLHMFGLYYDLPKAIRSIVKIDPSTEKLDLLLSRYVNIREFNIENAEYSSMPFAELNTQLIDSIALLKNTHLPYFWEICAGYLNYLDSNYTQASKFYHLAKQHAPKENPLLDAQIKILDWQLYLKTLKRIGPEEEEPIATYLNWLADLNTEKETIQNLRFQRSLTIGLKMLSDLYRSQHEFVKSNALQSTPWFYTDEKRIEAMKSFLNNPRKSAIEKALQRHYIYTLDNLNYFQSITAYYKEDIEAAIKFNKLSAEAQSEDGLVNPFVVKTKDCNDCIINDSTNVSITPLDFLKQVQIIKQKISNGKNISANALLLGNAYYNTSFYGNSRSFYTVALTRDYGSYASYIPKEFRNIFMSMKKAKKYYQMARAASKNAEFKAKCTFMLAKCEHNDSYNAYSNERDYIGFEQIEPGKYFLELKQNYSLTKYYKEALSECGYFSSYVNAN